MKLEDYIEQVIGEYKDSVRTKKATAASLGFLPTRDIVPLLGLSTLSGARLPLQRMIKAGFVERKHINPVRFAFRLSPSTLHPSTFNLQPSTFTLHPSPFNLHPSTFTIVVHPNHIPNPNPNLYL